MASIDPSDNSHESTPSTSEVEDNGTNYFPWEDPEDKGIDWSQVVLEGEPYDGPPGDGSVYSDLEDVTKIQEG